MIAIAGEVAVGSRRSEGDHRYNGRTVKRARRVAIVALARKLIVALWRSLTGLIPEQAAMKA